MCAERYGQPTMCGEALRPNMTVAPWRGYENSYDCMRNRRSCEVPLLYYSTAVLVGPWLPGEARGVSASGRGAGLQELSYIYTITVYLGPSLPGDRCVLPYASLCLRSQLSRIFIFPPSHP